MKKFLHKICILALCFVGITSVAWASSLDDAINIGRDKELPPVVYNTPKIFHKVLANIFGEKFSEILSSNNAHISVLNTEKLGNIAAEKFLKKTFVPCSGGQVAMGINSMGAIRCASKNPTFLVKASIRSGKVTIENSAGSWQIGTGEILDIREPTTFETGSPSGNESAELYRAEIVFPEDNSLIRMDAWTKIVLQPITRQENGRTRTIAQASYGGQWLLWGRILSDDGPEFRNNQIIAGVRGTSLAMRENNNIMVIQSRVPIGKPAIALKSAGASLSQPKVQEVWKCTKITPSIPWVWSGGFQSKSFSTEVGWFHIESLVSSTSLSDSFMNKQSIRDIISKPSASTHCMLEEDWVRENTKKDIAYMNILLGKGWDMPVGNIDAIIQEQESITATTWIQPNSPLCNADRPVYWAGMTNVDDMCQADDISAILEVIKIEPDNWRYRLSYKDKYWSDKQKEGSLYKKSENISSADGTPISHSGGTVISPDDPIILPEDMQLTQNRGKIKVMTSTVTNFMFYVKTWFFTKEWKAEVIPINIVNSKTIGTHAGYWCAWGDEFSYSYCADGVFDLSRTIMQDNLSRKNY